MTLRGRVKWTKGGQADKRIWTSLCWTTMSLSLVSNAHLDDISAKIRSKPVPWEVRQLDFISA